MDVPVAIPVEPTDDQLAAIILQTIKTALLEYTQQKEYKNGAFRDQITNATSILADLQTLTDSIHTHDNEKAKLRSVMARARFLLFVVGAKLQINREQLRDLAENTVFVLEGIFQEDIEARNRDEETELHQELDADHNVIRTTVINHRTKEVDVYPGGELGIIPVASSANKSAGYLHIDEAGYKVGPDEIQVDRRR